MRKLDKLGNLDMNKAEQYQRFDRRDIPRSPSEHVRPDYVQVYVSEEEEVAWPPVIARVRDLDRIPSTENRPNQISQEKKRDSVSFSVPASVQSKFLQKISSRMIAVAGLIILVVAVIPTMWMRNSGKDETDSQPAWELASPSSSSDTAPSWSGNSAKANDLIANSPKSSRSNNSPLLNDNIKPSADMASSVPPLYPHPSQAEENNRWPPNAYPASNAMGGRTDEPVEQIARRTLPKREPAPAPSRAPQIQNWQQPANTMPERNADQNGYSTWPNQSAPKTDPPYADNGMLRGAPELPAILPGAASERSNLPTENSNRAMVSGGSNPQNNVPPLYYPPRTSGYDAGNDYRGPVQDNSRGVYQADTRGDYRRANNVTPDYRMNPVVGQNAPVSGQNPPLYRQNAANYGQQQLQGVQNPAAYGQNPTAYRPPVSTGRGGAQTAQPPLYNPNRVPVRSNPATQPNSTNPQSYPGTDAGPIDAYPATTAPNNINNSGAGTTDGFSYPATENPPARNPYERPRPSIY
jgi:hypothetical protein